MCPLGAEFGRPRDGRARKNEKPCAVVFFALATPKTKHGRFRPLSTKHSGYTQQAHTHAPISLNPFTTRALRPPQPQAHRCRRHSRRQHPATPRPRASPGGRQAGGAARRRRADCVVVWWGEEVSFYLRGGLHSLTYLPHSPALLAARRPLRPALRRSRAKPVSKTRPQTERRRR